MGYLAGVLIFLAVYGLFTPDAKQNEFSIACDAMTVCIHKAEAKCFDKGYKVLKAVSLGVPSLIVVDCDVEGDGGEE